MMRTKIHRLVWCLALWLLCSLGAANAASQVEAPAAWQRTPVMSEDVRPTCEFRSTSTYTPIVGLTSYTSTTVYTPGASNPYRAKKDSWGDPTGDGDELPVGVLPVTPVGEPFILLLFGVLMMVSIYTKKRVTAK